MILNVIKYVKRFGALGEHGWAQGQRCLELSQIPF